jgi:hypothetical protein
MLAAVIAIFCILSFLFLLVGGVIGWLSREHVFVTQPVYTHPEMFDENGNVLPDEILAVRFENNYDNDEEEEN